jgi:hypothetical protein
MLAEYLLESGQPGQARELLDQALQDHYYAPGPLRRRNRRWAGEARRLQKCADKKINSATEGTENTEQ